MIWSWRGCFTLIIVLTQAGSHWLNCAHIKECHCKWSSGKKTASCISVGLQRLPRLDSDIQVLDINRNPLKILEEDEFININLLNLQRLNLSSTSLRSLHPNAFRELRILVELDLSQNELIHLSPETFKGADRLRLLILNDNPLRYLVDEQFPPLKHLKKLEISQCKLQSVHPFAFINLQALETINIHRNLLTFLHQDTFNLPVLKSLTLSENPWNCDCRLREFHDWFLNSNLGNEEVFCSSPKPKENLPWRSLKREDFVCLPSAFSSPTVIRTEAGADISFGCFVKGDPKPSVTWSLRQKEVDNSSFKISDISINKYYLNHFDEYNDDFLNKSAQWVNVTITNVTTDFAGEWKCGAKSSVGEATAYTTLFLPKARTATARVAPNYSKFLLIGGSMLAMTLVGFIVTCVCWKTKYRRVPASRSFTDQEKKLLDNSLAVSCDRTSADLGSAYGFEMLDKSISIESDDARCLEPLQITIEGPPGSFPPPPAEFALPAPYSNIFISVQMGSHSKDYPDLLGGGATLPRRSRTCILKSAYDNMGPRITADGSSTWSLPGVNNADQKLDDNDPMCVPLSTYSTEFTAL